MNEQERQVWDAHIDWIRRQFRPEDLKRGHYQPVFLAADAELRDLREVARVAEEACQGRATQADLAFALRKWRGEVAGAPIKQVDGDLHGQP